jgi:uncharacterized protein (TIGR03437 family)
MSLRVRFLTILVTLFCFTLGAYADTVFVLPNANFSPNVNTYDAETLATAGAYQAAAGTVSNVVSTPDGMRNYTTSRVTEEALIVTNESQSVLFRSGTWNSPGETGQITPDGKYALALGGVLWIYDADTGNQLTTVSTGSSPIDFAVSIDSSYALVLSPNSSRLYKVDLTSFSVVDVFDISGTSTAVAAGPNCLFYVSTTNSVLVIDGETMEKVEDIRLTGLPNKLYFTPDGRYAIASNSQTSTNASIWIFDILSNSVAVKKDRLMMGTIPVRITPRIEVVSNDRLLMTSKTNKIIYRVSIPDGEIKVYEPSGVPLPDDVEGIVKSNEYPNAKNMYFVEVTALNKVRLDTDSVQGSNAIVPNNVAGLDFAAPASTATPTDAILYNDGQRVEEGEDFKPIVVRALDVNGRPVFGASVEWNAPEGATIFNSMTRTNKDGLAKATVIANDILGPVPVEAFVGSALSVTFNLSVGLGGGIPGASGISIHSGQGQLVGDTFFIFSEPFKVRILNPDGSPVDDATVEWAITAGRGGVGASTSRTDDDGFAIMTFQGPFISPGVSFEQATVTASYGDGSVDFYITTYPTVFQGNLLPPPLATIRRPSPSGRDFVGRIGEIQEDAIEGFVVAVSGISSGTGIPNVAMVADTGNDPALGPVATCAPSGFALTSELGVQLCDLQFLGQVGQSSMRVSIGGTNFASFLNFSVEVLPGAPASVKKLQGDGQSGDPGEVLPTALVAQVVDAAGNPLAGEPVDWQILPAGAATLSDVDLVSDGSGMASAKVQLGNTPGAVRVQVTSGGVSATYVLQVSVQATQLNYVSGNNQLAMVGMPFDSFLVVQLLDENNQGVANQTIRFDVTNGSATLGSPDAMTDATGRASMSVTAGQNAGVVTVVASYGNLAPVSFNLAVRLPGPGILPSSFRNGASNEIGVVPGSVVKIVARGIAPNVQNCVVPHSRGALPYELAGVTVQFGTDSNPMLAPIYYVCNINGEESVSVQAPFELTPGLVSSTVRVQGGATTVENVRVLIAQPGVFETTGPSGLRHAVVMRPDGSFVSPSNPARRGETLCVFSTGLGATNPASGTNHAGIMGQAVQFDLVVGVNNEGVRVLGGEYAVNMIGVYAVYFEIPQDSGVGLNLPFALAIRVSDDELVFGNGSAIAVQ